MVESPKIFTLKQVVSSIRKTIDERYKNLYWVKAEMHKLNQFPSGHCFPELLQKEDGKIVAQISGSIWKHNFEKINKRFIDVVKEPLKEDTTLLLQVKVSFHEMYGLSLQIMDIDPNYALGELQKERQETLKKLQKDGLINANQQLEFPVLPKRIAVISADASKGLSDFMQVIETNDWNYQFFTMLFPASLQGDHAANSIIKQLERIKKVLHHFDCVVIVRGGGGEVGLSCYNNYDLCRNIAKFPLPVLTGIGHSTNLTVAEMVAFRNAITPTELGDFLLQVFHNFSVPVKDAVKRLKVSTSNVTTTSKLALNNASKLFRSVVKQSVSRNKQVVLSNIKDLENNIRVVQLNESNSIQRLEQGVYKNSKLLLASKKNDLNASSKAMAHSTASLFKARENLLSQMEQSVRLMNPINVLNRGYSISLINGKSISRDNKVKKGDRIQTKTATFSIQSEVVEIEKPKDE